MLALLPNPHHRPSVLACDTSQQACSVALALSDGTIIERLEETGRGHTEKLPLMIAMIDAVLEDKKLDILIPILFKIII